MDQPEQEPRPQTPPVDQVLRAAVREIEAHVAESGWDQPARLYALVPTADLLQREPRLAAAMGLDEATAAGTLTPVEQDQVPVDRPLEEVLAGIMWPAAEVFGCAAVLERLVLPPSAGEGLPEDPAAAATYAAEHPEREEVRVVAAATREGATYCSLRLRSREDQQPIESPDLVPGLLELLQDTLSF